MKFYYTIILSFISFGNLYSQNKIASYGSLFIDWAEFSFYDNNTYVHTIYKRKRIGKQITKGKYTTKGDTIILLDKIQYTYEHGNRSSKFLKSGDTLLIDLDILHGYLKFTSIKDLKEQVDTITSVDGTLVFWGKYFSETQKIKFPYKPFKNEAQRKDVSVVLQDFFQNKIVKTFFETDSVILVRFFYQVETNSLELSVPQKIIKFIEYSDEKTRNPKRMKFEQFYILEDQQTIFFLVTLYGKNRIGITKHYNVEYKKEDGQWKLNYIHKTKHGGGSLF